MHLSTGNIYIYITIIKKFKCRGRYISEKIRNTKLEKNYRKYTGDTLPNTKRYHFGPVRVRILLAQNCVMAEAHTPVQAAVPAFQAPVQPPAAPANVDNRQNPLQPPFKRLKFSYTVPAWESCGSFSPLSVKRDSISWMRHDGKPLQARIQSPQLCNSLLASDWVESVSHGDVSADVSMLAFRIMLHL